MPLNGLYRLVQFFCRFAHLDRKQKRHFFHKFTVIKNGRFKNEKFNCSMTSKRVKIIYGIIFLLILNLFFYEKVFAQATSSLFMLQDNFRSQILNPSYKRTDDAIIISIVGLAGANVGNSGDFKISDITTKNPEGKMVADFERFSTLGNTAGSATDWTSLPVVFVSIPLSEGRLTLYYQEQVTSSLNFDISEVEFTNIDNFQGTLRSYNTSNIDFTGMGYREIAAGYAKDINEKISIGIRGKVLFSGAFTYVEDWSYGINTTKNNNELELTHKGTGKLMVPVTIELNNSNRVSSMESKNSVGKYLSSFHNPGLGIDLGATVNLNEKSWLSMSATDLGFIWFRHNSMEIMQNDSYLFSSSEIPNYVETNSAGSYFDPYNLIVKTKDAIPHLYRPVVDTASFLQGIVPKTAIHYQYNISDNLSVGATNQTAFYKNNFMNIFSLSGLQKKGNFSFFENVNLYGLNQFTFGGGVQWEGRYIQFFASTDNLLAVYSPTKSESFSFSAGICLLINKPVKRKNSGGKTSPQFPFYENKK